MITCKNCNKQNEDDFTFCMHCGEPLEKTYKQPPSSNEIPAAGGKEKPSAAKYLAMAAAAPVLAGVVWLLEGKRGMNEQGTIMDAFGKPVIEYVNIPAGTFMMGSPDSEPEIYDWEDPQHQVTLSAFKMS